MHLDQYLREPGALTVSQLRKQINVKSDMQIRQWRHGYANRQPSPECAVAIERATNRMVMRWDSRPNDWHRIWPELIGAEGAPAAPDPRKADLGPSARGKAPAQPAREV